MLANPFVKTCACGAEYTIEQWQRLLFAGVFLRLEGGFAELRTCQCGSSITLEVRVVTCIALVPGNGAAVPARVSGA